MPRNVVSIFRSSKNLKKCFEEKQKCADVCIAMSEL